MLLSYLVLAHGEDNCRERGKMVEGGTMGGSKSSSTILSMSADVRERTSGLEEEVVDREVTPEEELR